MYITYSAYKAGNVTILFATHSCNVLSAEKALATGEAAGEDAEEADEGDEGEWEVAAKSHNAARRQKRKQARRANWAAAAAQRAAQADESKEDPHHLEGTADGGDSEGWETDGIAQTSICVLQTPHITRGLGRQIDPCMDKATTLCIA